MTLIKSAPYYLKGQINAKIEAGHEGLGTGNLLVE